MKIKFFTLIAILSFGLCFSYNPDVQIENESDIISQIEIENKVPNRLVSEIVMINLESKDNLKEVVVEIDCVEVAATMFAEAMTSGFSEEDAYEFADTMFAVCGVLKLVSFFINNPD